MTAALFPDLVVNGVTVPHAQVAAEAQNHAAPRGKPGIAWRKATNAVAIRTLLLQEARRRALSPAPTEVSPGRFETDEEALIRALLDTCVDVASPTLDEVRAEFERDPTRFRAPVLWEVSHILCACDPSNNTARDQARARATDLARRANEDVRGFGRLAAEHSDCGSKSAGGRLGQISPGDTVPEFETALRCLGAGETTTEPVLTRYGWHVVRMDAVAEGEVLPFEVARPRIAEAMEKAAWTRAAKDFVDQLVAAADISGAALNTLVPA